MEYSQQQYEYKCFICSTTHFTEIIEECEECEYPDVYDDKDNIHSHDLNGGDVILTCENGHKTTQIYIAKCECGWNSIDGDAASCETFVNSKEVKGLFDSDNDW